MTNDLLSTFSFLSFLFWFFSWRWWWPCGIEGAGLSFCLSLPLLRCSSYLAVLLFQCLWPCCGLQWVSGPYGASYSFCPWAPLGLLRSTTSSRGLSGLTSSQLLSHISLDCMYFLRLYLLILYYVSLFTCWIWDLTLEIEACKSLYLGFLHFIWDLYNCLHHLKILYTCVQFFFYPKCLLAEESFLNKHFISFFFL